MEVKKLKRTNMETCCGKHCQVDVYRTILTDGEHYYVRWNGELLNVDEDVKNRNYRFK